ncbi:DUF3300 domain-containing protein [Shewanella gelidii]|uniref:DUF3300 domain-containing protein n=1 Tax=Shewanella gelidii TaxID=1642821 RepID=A0A917JJW6_9GAMM|nr:DUF3300 domain-containing protein [Shewanella gelidii]MCL1097184.1 DUF3300 domain-containing protein [Shewanella gelidii]GGI73113.1 hypothetical protein GCM10009332_08300 [Shewanella gelidii]
MKSGLNWRNLTIGIALSAVSLSSTMAVAASDNNDQARATSYGDGGQYSDSYDQQIFNRAQLEQMLAPIALYPDSLLTHILIAATYPLEIVQAYRWQQEYQYLNTKRLMRKAEKQNWDPSVKALVAFPSVLKQLNEDLDWTQNLGDAFLQNEARVLDSIQSLRQQAYQADNLDNMGNLAVRHVGQKIIIEPTRTEVIYVPYYDTRVVYGHWRWHKYPPVYWHMQPSYVGVNIGYGRHANYRHSHFYWNTGVQISFNYFFSSFHWHKRHVVVTSHRNSHYYRPRQRIVTSHGAKRWQHKPEHRRGVHYRSQSVEKRFSKSRHTKHQLTKSDKRSSHNVKSTAHKSREQHKAVQQRLNQTRVKSSHQTKHAQKTYSKPRLNNEARHKQPRVKAQYNTRNSNTQYKDSSRKASKTRTEQHQSVNKVPQRKQAQASRIRSQQSSQKSRSSNQSRSKSHKSNSHARTKSREK